MTRRLSIFGLVLALGASAAACLPGSGTSKLGSAPGATPSGIVEAPPAGTETGTETGSPPPGAAAAAGAGGGDTTMPPRADAGDCMTIGPDGTIVCGGVERRSSCRIFYVPAPSIKVFSGHGAELPPILQEGKKVFSGRFYAENGSADLSCEDPSCWVWEGANGGDYIRMRLLRLQPDAPQLQFYQDAGVLAFPVDGANVEFKDVPIQDEDAIEFYTTNTETLPYGFTPVLSPLTDDVWSKFGAQCEMGGFRIDTGDAYERKFDLPVIEKYFR